LNEDFYMKNQHSSDRTGYKRPPVEHQFAPGTSGNPAGRPKGRRNFLAELADELSEPVDGPNGGPTKQRAIIKNLVDNAIHGDARAIGALLALAGRTSTVPEPESEDDGPEDRAIAESFSRSHDETGEAE
jgi:hypothetical protein